VSDDDFDLWVSNVATYLVELEESLFSSGLHTLGSKPTEKELCSYLNAYFKDKLSENEIKDIITSVQRDSASHLTHDAWWHSMLSWMQEFPKNFMGDGTPSADITNITVKDDTKKEATAIVTLLSKNTEELDSVVNALNGGYVLPAPGGDLLRDGTSVLPTGRNIHALDPYRMPSALAWARGTRAAEEIIKQHKSSNNGAFPETVGEWEEVKHRETWMQ
jgi:magnesium chelatase subunit H